MTVLDQSSPESQFSKDAIIITSNPNSLEWRQGAEIEAEVFIESGYVDSAEELAEEYEKYAPQTQFIVTNHEGEAGGSVRLIYYDPDVGFKTIDDIEKGKLNLSEAGREHLAQIDLNDAVEVGTIAVKKELRSDPGNNTRLSVSLYGVLSEVSEGAGRPTILASFDYRYYRGFKAIFGSAVTLLGEPKDYMGSKTVPVSIAVPQLMEYIKGKRPELYENMKASVSKIVRFTQ